MALLRLAGTFFVFWNVVHVCDLSPIFRDVIRALAYFAEIELLAAQLRNELIAHICGISLVFTVTFLVNSLSPSYIHGVRRKLFIENSNPG